MVLNTKYRNKSFSFLTIMVILFGLLIISGLFALKLGTPKLSLGQLLEIVKGEGAEQIRIVVLELRLPRFILGTLAGMMLALSGVILQDSMRNALAGPEILGVSSGAAAVMAIIIVFHIPVAFALHPLLAMSGGLIGGGIVLASIRKNPNPIHLVVVGAAVSALLFSIVIAVISYGSDTAISLLYQFLTGSLASRTWDHVWILLPWAFVGIPLAIFSAERLNVIRLGDEVAMGLGLNVNKTRMLFMLLSIALVASVVSVSGPISYIALLTPHLTRRLLNTERAQLVLPISSLLGALLLTLADLLSRRVFAPQEISVGIWTTIIGGPILLFLLQQMIRRVRHR
ncbi:MAG TPA: iron ABC transporter permease [Bacillales bacterium]|nr:iron ABC transporter permease [Bacillales bacterium]